MSELMPMLHFVLLWFVLILLAEFVLAVRVSSQYGASVSFVLLLSTAVGVSGLELLAVTMAIVYTSVFIVLFVVILHFWSLSSKTTSGFGAISAASGFFFLSFMCVAIFVAVGPVLFYFSGVDGLDSLLWCSLVDDSSVTQVNITGVLHILVMRTFLLQTVIMNIWLLVGFIAALVILRNLFIFGFTGGRISNTHVAASLRVKRN